MYRIIGRENLGFISNKFTPSSYRHQYFFNTKKAIQRGGSDYFNGELSTFVERVTDSINAHRIPQIQNIHHRHKPFSVHNGSEIHGKKLFKILLNIVIEVAKKHFGIF